MSSLLQETDLNPMQSESLKMVTSSSELLLTVVNDVLDYSKLESGNVDVTIRRCSLQEALSGVVHSIEMKSREKNIKVHTFYDPYVPEFWSIDPLRLQQILFNLLGNAYKFSPTDSSIDLSAQLDKPESVELAGVHDQVLRFSIKDYGCGIKKENLKSIFKPFVQVGSDESKIFEGTGLGLAITSKLVKAMGGAVYAKSEEGKWSEFHVEFPFEISDIPDHVTIDIGEGDFNKDVTTSNTTKLLPNQPADVQGMSKRLSNKTVLLVHSSAHDYEASQSLPHIERIFQAYHIDYIILKKMDELDEFTVGEDATTIPESDRPRLLDPHRCYICLVDETLYQREPLERLSSRVSTVLLSFGPEFGVEETAGHWRNLLQVLPSVLMQSIIEAVEEATGVSPENNAAVDSGFQGIPDSSGNARHHSFLKPITRTSVRTRPRDEVSILVAEGNLNFDS